MSFSKQRSSTGSDSWGALDAGKRSLPTATQAHRKEEGAMPTAQAASKVRTELLLSSLGGRASSRLPDRNTQRWGLGNLYFKGQHETAYRVPVSHYKQRLFFTACHTVFDVDYKYH